jgi:hypothetical protein
MQSYFAEGDRDARLSKLIFKARGWTLDIKMDKNGSMMIPNVVDVINMKKRERK